MSISIINKRLFYMYIGNNKILFYFFNIYILFFRKSKLKIIIEIEEKKIIRYLINFQFQFYIIYKYFVY